MIALSLLLVVSVVVSYACGRSRRGKKPDVRVRESSGPTSISNPDLLRSIRKARRWPR